MQDELNVLVESINYNETILKQHLNVLRVVPFGDSKP